MGNFGMKVLLHDIYPDADVKTATPKQLAWSSQYRHLMIYKMGIATAAGTTIPNELGYRTGTAHYLKKDDKYIEGSSGGSEFAGLESQNNINGQFRSSPTQYLVTNGGLQLPYPMVYVAYANAIDPSDLGNTLAGTKDFGLKMGSDALGIYAPEGQIRLSSKFRPVQIIQAGTVTLNLPSRSGDLGVYQPGQTTYQDVLHGRGQANHIILRRETTGNWFLYPAPTGQNAGNEVYGYEVFIDATKIRFRFSRNMVTAGGPYVGMPYTMPATSHTFTYYLTNIPLPT